MDEGSQRGLDTCPSARADWVHELRNAVNRAGVSGSLAKRLLERGEADAAMDMLARSLTALEDCRHLLAHADAATAFGEGATQPLGSTDADAPAPRRQYLHQ